MRRGGLGKKGNIAECLSSRSNSDETIQNVIIPTVDGAIV